jgi:8-oxo-dGTP pyrophosphatase MutT (NUDIX family)
MTLAVSAATDEHGGAQRGSGDLIDRGPSVVIVLMEADEVVLVRQRREAVTGETMELVQERLKPGESPLEAAIRGVAGECGVSASMWEEHGGFWAAPAYSNQRVHVFSARLAQGLPAPGSETTTVVRCRTADVDALLDDAISIAGLSVVRRSSGVQPQ